MKDSNKLNKQQFTSTFLSRVLPLNLSKQQAVPANDFFQDTNPEKGEFRKPVNKKLITSKYSNEGFPEELLVYQIIHKPFLEVAPLPFVLDQAPSNFFPFEYFFSQISSNLTKAYNYSNKYEYGDIVIGTKVDTKFGSWLKLSITECQPRYLPIEVLPYSLSSNPKKSKPLLRFIKSLKPPENIDETGLEKTKVEQQLLNELLRLSSEKFCQSEQFFEQKKEDKGEISDNLALEKEESLRCKKAKTWAGCTRLGFCAWKRKPNRQFCYRDSAPKGVKSFDLTSTEVHHQDFDLRKIDEYRKREEKFLIYQPSGGMNNQRQQLANSLITCRILNRTCIVPPAASHTNFYENYNKQPGNRVTSQRRLLNPKLLSHAVKLLFIPEGLNLVEFLGLLQNVTSIETEWEIVERDYAKFKKGSHSKWNEPTIEKKWGDLQTQYFYFSGKSMWASFEWKGTRFGYFHRKSIVEHLTFHNQFKRLARVISNELSLASTGGKTDTLRGFNAIHVRRGDKTTEKNFLSVSHNIEWYVERLRVWKNLTSTVYVATDETNRKYFAPLQKEGLKVIFHEDLNPALSGFLLKKFLESFPERMESDILSIIEQLVCAYSQKFLGSGYSTLSVFVLRLRRRRTVIGYDTRLGNMKGLPRYAQGDTNCNPLRPKEHTRPC
eukprot:maker-scaffold_9-snap-gene-0.0-mRNA-1 protein AED:0.27 eAED:1.00 QI:0/0/0/1/1/1/2/0/662